MLPHSPNIHRFEIKCLIPVSLTPKVRALAEPFVKVDRHAQGRPNNRYQVKSLYYDTNQLDFYYEKKDGLKIRKKLRVRAYNDCAKEDSGFLEIKRRYVNNIVKERYQMPLSEIENLLQNQERLNISLEESSNGKAALARFVYNMERRQLLPTALIVYDREAYVGIQDETTRLTLDFDISSKFFPDFGELFAGRDLKPVYNNMCVLELKYNEFMPQWMRKILSTLNIRPEPVSKYCAGIDANLNEPD